MYNIQAFRKGNRIRPPSSLLSGLVSYWKFNESSGNAADSASTNTLTNNNTATYVAGKIGNGVNLVAASSQYMSITDGAQVGLGITGSMSAALWFKPSSQNNSEVFMLVTKFNYSTGNQRSYQFYYEDETGSGGFRLSMGVSSDGSSAGVARFATTLTVGTFYHIVYVYDSVAGSGQVYVNGVSLGTLATLPNSIFNSTADFRIGANHAGLYADGVVDETGVWSRTLTAAEVTSLYNGGAGNTYPFVS